MKRIFLMIILSLAILATASGCQTSSKKSQLQKSTTKPSSAISGAEIYKSKCLSCHGMRGQGSSKAPAINTAEFKDSNKVMTVVKNGKGNMPSFKDKLTDAQIKAVSNYVATFIKK